MNAVLAEMAAFVGTQLSEQPQNSTLLSCIETFSAIRFWGSIMLLLSIVVSLLFEPFVAR